MTSDRWVPQPTRIRAVLVGSSTEIRMLLSHPMRSGLRHYADQTPEPVHYVTEIWVRRAGKTVMSIDLGKSMAENPYFLFHLSGGQVGDLIEVHWRDSRGFERRDTAEVS